MALPILALSENFIIQNTNQETAQKKTKKKGKDWL